MTKADLVQKVADAIGPGVTKRDCAVVVDSFLNSIKDGTVKMINMEKYETMDFFGVLYLYVFHNDIIRNMGMDHWLQNPLPVLGDSGLIFVTAENVDVILKATEGAK